MLKGTTIIELTDVKSGEVKVVKEENYITNAISDLCQPILRNQDTLLSTYFREEKIVNVEALLRGLLLFGSNLGDNPNDYFPPSSARMIGHGGSMTYAGSDLSMGSFNVGQSDLTSPNERSYVWDFTAEQANGVINSVCLTTQIGGQIGYGSETKPERDSTALKSFSNILKSRLRVETNSSVPALERVPVFLSLMSDYLLTFNAAAFVLGELKFQKFHLNTKKVDIFKRFPSISSAEAWQRGCNFVGETYTSKEEVVIPYPSNFSKAGTNFGTAQDGKFLYIVEPSNLQESVANNAWVPNATIKILKIDLHTLEYEVLSVTNTTGKHLAMRINSAYMGSACHTFGVCNGYLFARSWAQTGGVEVSELFAINLSNNSDVRQIADRSGKTLIVGFDSNNASTPFTMTIQGKVCFSTESYRPNQGTSGQNKNVMAVVSTNDFIVNYYASPIVSIFSVDSAFVSNSQHAKLLPTDNKLYYVVEERQSDGSTNESLFNVHVYPNALMTINNLQSPIEKTPAQTMRVTYKIVKEE